MTAAPSCATCPTMSMFRVPYHGDIRIESRVRYGELEWIVRDIWQSPLAGTRMDLVPPPSRPGKNCHSHIANVSAEHVALITEPRP